MSKWKQYSVVRAWTHRFLQMKCFKNIWVHTSSPVSSSHPRVAQKPTRSRSHHQFCSNLESGGQREGGDVSEYD